MDMRKYKLLTVLSTTKELLLRSTENGWPDEKPADALKIVNELMERLFSRDVALPEYWEIQFAPTGPIQEIAMNNGWQDTYMKLAETFDENSSFLTGTPLG